MSPTRTPPMQGNERKLLRVEGEGCQRACHLYFSTAVSHSTHGTASSQWICRAPARNTGRAKSYQYSPSVIDHYPFLFIRRSSLYISDTGRRRGTYCSAFPLHIQLLCKSRTRCPSSMSHFHRVDSPHYLHENRSRFHSNTCTCHRCSHILGTYAARVAGCSPKN